MSIERLTGELRRFGSGLAGTAPRTGALLERFAEDIERGGPVGALLVGHHAAGAPLFAMRALAAAHQLSLTGRAAGLTSSLAGPERDIWPAVSAAMLANADYVVAALERPVQQTGPRRSAALVRGLSMLGARRVRLLEIGACAGINLAFDRFHWQGPGWEWGDPASPVRLAAEGSRPNGMEIVERLGCDLDPRDPRDPADVLILRSFVPPEHTIERRELDAALTVVAGLDIRVERASAAEWLRSVLSRPADPDVYTVVWHSMVWHYLDNDEQNAIDAIFTAASASMPLARVSYEPSQWSARQRIGLTIFS